LAIALPYSFVKEVVKRTASSTNTDVEQKIINAIAEYSYEVRPNNNP